MKKTELIDVLAEKSGATKRDCTHVYEALLEIVEDYAATGSGELVLPGIGKFKTVDRVARTIRNPKTGEKLAVPAKTAVKFQLFPKLRNARAA